MMPKKAMVLAAGRGTRLMPFTQDQPKALVEVGGRTLLDHQLDRLQAVGVKQAVVNVHHFSDQVETHLAARSGVPSITVSDERDCLLETGGALVRAKALLGAGSFIVMNCDAIWDDVQTSPLIALANQFTKVEQPAVVLLLARKEHSLGLDTRGDFAMDDSGRLRRPAAGETVPFYYAGTQIMHPAWLEGEAERPFSANLLWNKALAEGQLYGVVLEGFWLHVGDPAALAAANTRLTEKHP